MRNPANRACERAGESVVLVILTWGDEALLARTVEKGQSLWLGSRPGDLPIPVTPGATGRFQLVSFNGPVPLLALPGSVEGGQKVALARSAEVKLELGEFSLTITRVGVDRALCSRFSSSSGLARYVAATSAALVSMVVVFAYQLPLLGRLDAAGIERAMALDVRPPLRALAEPETSLPLHFSPEPTRYLIPVPGPTGCRGDSMGWPEAVADGRYATEGPKDNPDPHVATERGDMPSEAVDDRSAKSAGADRKALTAPWGRRTALGTDDKSVRGAMWEQWTQDGYGENGFGVPGVDGGIAKRLDWATRSSSGRPRILHTGLRVSGPLRPSLVTGALASRFDRFRACYTRALERTPDLRGSVELRFRVARTGRLSASVGRTSVADPELSGCLMASVRDLVLPTDSRNSAFSYPLFFEPGSGGGPALRVARGEPPRERLPACCFR